MTTSNDILNFWFTEIDPKKWWVKDPAFDQLLKTKFGATHDRAIKGELAYWRETADGRLAEVLVIDQFSRNIYREDPRSFAYDPIALKLAEECVALKLDQELPIKQRAFLYLPYMHSESKATHEIAVRLYSQPGLENNLDFELRHKALIDRFGRYPHRNKILGRPSTPEEIEFLKQPGSSF